jgi:ABC-type polysaccharide/polyol phosphate export permease
VSGIWQQLRMSLTLYFRNRMAMLYGYLFPSVFLLAFYVLYRYERVPLVRHMGELLTVTILGGACFGMATTLVSERERGVWRRYRLTPIPTGALVVSTVIARYVLLLTAGLLQLALAMALGMPLPDHPLQLAVAFSLAALAFLGLGLVIAMLADNVPAVQALGQTIFLPMLIIGGVAVPLTSLPDWALHLSAFFPGRYAVEAIQATVNGAGLSAVGFSLLALLLIGASACAAGAGMFRWDAKQRFATSGGKAWLGVALAGWVSIGLLAQWQERVIPTELMAERAAIAAAAAETPQTSSPTQSSAVTSGPTLEQSAPSPAGASSASTPAPTPAAPAPAAPAPVATTPTTPALPSASSGEVTPPATAATAPSAAVPVAPWEKVTIEQVMADLVFDRLPPDAGVVTPVAGLAQEPPEEVWTDLDVMYNGLQTWAPGRVPDILARTRNLLLVPAVVDVFQLPMEAHVPLMVYEILERDIDRDVLIKALYWIAVNPDEGSDAAVDQMAPLGLPNGPSDIQEVRGRLGVYAVKLIGRLTGARPAR